MDITDIRYLFQYNRWANGLVLEACGALTEAQLRSPAQVSFQNIFGTLAHVYGAERVWRERMQDGVSPGRLLGGEDFDSFAAFEQAWRDEMALMEAFVNGLDGADLERWVEYTTTGGGQQGSTLWKALLHVAFHGAQFRAEAGAAMGAMGHSPGDLDMIRYQRETGQR